MTDETLSKNHDLLRRAAKLLESGHAVFDDQIELIMAVLFLILEHPYGKQKFYLVLSKKLTTEIEGTILDKISAVINKTHLMKGENSSINDDIALELITQYLLEHDEFIFHKNKKRILRRPKSNNEKNGRNRGNY
jgi:hypothetical protein